MPCASRAQRAEPAEPSRRVETAGPPKTYLRPGFRMKNKHFVFLLFLDSEHQKMLDGQTLLSSQSDNNNEKFLQKL